MRQRRIALALGLAGALAAPAASAQTAPRWRTVDFARQLRDTLPQRVRVQYGAGKIDIRGTDDPLLYAMRLRYDESRSLPLHRFDADQRSVVLGLESRGRALTSPSGESGDLQLALPRRVPLDLSFELGGTQSTLELGGLALQSLRLECGATDATLMFTSPNRTRMRDLEIDAGAADFFALHLANANAEQIRVRGGVGVIDLELGGTWTSDMTLIARLGVGRIVLRIPPDVGVRLEVQRIAAGFEHEGLVKRDDAWYSPNWDTAAHHLRVRAETLIGQIDVQHEIR